jgi:hypothetical protein
MRELVTPVRAEIIVALLLVYLQWRNTQRQIQHHYSKTGCKTSGNSKIIIEQILHEY